MSKTFNLDSSTCINVIRNKIPNARRHFSDALNNGHAIVISSIVLYELAHGVGMSSDPKRRNALLKHFLAGVNVLEFDSDDAMKAGEIRAALSKRGKAIGPFDTLIAGQALVRNQTMVTANTKEFSRVPGLTVMSWRTP